VSSTRRARARTIPSDPTRWAPCTRCGTSYQRARLWPEGRVCHYCATAALQRHGRCASCDHDGVLPGFDTAGAPTCLTCSQIPAEAHCRRCGAEAPLGRSSTCWRCQLTRKTQTLLAGPGGTVPTPLQPLADAITTMPSANSGHTWLSNPSVARVLAQLTSGEVSLDHAALDRLPASRTVEHLRGLLIAEGCLFARDPHLAGYERWLATKLDTISDPEHRKTIDRFAHWHLLRQLRARAADGPISDGAFLNAKQSTTVAVGFLTWLAGRGIELHQLSQHELDAWFAAGPTTRKHAVRFLYWARDQRIVANLDIPVAHTNNTHLMGPRQRLDHLRRVLTDDTLGLAPRLAGALVLLFGASLDQIAALTLDDITSNDDGVRIRLGTSPILLPDPVAGLLQAFLDDPRYRRNTVTNQHSRWLFPGVRPGKPIHLNTLSKMLDSAAVPARPARAGAWTELVRSAPPAILADALGISAATAMRYASRAGTNLLAYPTSR